MVEKEQSKAAEKKGSVEKDQPKKEKDTLPIDTDELEDNKIQELNDGDEFEEFPIYTSPIDKTAELIVDDLGQEVNVWQTNWQDETVEKDFAIQLSEELGNKDILKQIV